MLVNVLKEIEDPRSFHGKEYQLWQILLVTILCILCNGKTYHDIRIFLEAHYDKLNAIFNFNWRQLPDESAIRKIIVRVDPKEVERAFNLFDNKTIGEIAKHLCADGKALKGSFSHTKDKRAFRVLGVFSAQDQLVLTSKALPGDKDHEIPAFQEFIMSLPIKGLIITADALHCQKKLLSVLN